MPNFKDNHDMPQAHCKLIFRTSNARDLSPEKVSNT